MEKNGSSKKNKRVCEAFFPLIVNILWILLTVFSQFLPPLFLFSPLHFPSLRTFQASTLALHTYSVVDSFFSPLPSFASPCSSHAMPSLFLSPSFFTHHLISLSSSVVFLAIPLTSAAAHTHTHTPAPHFLLLSSPVLVTISLRGCP